MCRLAHYSGHRNIRIEAARKNPYQYKPIRKVIDSLAFGIYGHWVKKGEGQNRAALFENTPKVEMKQAHISQLNAETNERGDGQDGVPFQLDPVAVSAAAMGKRRGQVADAKGGDKAAESPQIKVDWY